MGCFDIFYKFWNVLNIFDGFLLFIWRYFFKYWECFLLFDVSLKDWNLKGWLKFFFIGFFVNFLLVWYYKLEWNICLGVLS